MMVVEKGTIPSLLFCKGRTMHDGGDQPRTTTFLTNPTFLCANNTSKKEAGELAEGSE
jgi:hypothetical protein